MNHWENKVIAVTGGSEGLGREIALSFARCGGEVIVLGRDQSKLAALTQFAAESKPRFSIEGISTDLTDDASTRAAVDQIVSRRGRIDVWINNLGRSTRTALAETEIDEYRELMELNFFSAVRCTLLVLPLLKQTDGHLVNIGSLASKTGWPLIAPYATSKHALSAFHHQVRLEGPKNIHYLEVCTGPLTRTDAGVRYSDKSNGLGKSAAAPGAGVRIKGISPVWLAERIERACRQRKTEIIVPFYSRFLFALSHFFPNLGDRILMATRKRE